MIKKTRYKFLTLLLACMILVYTPASAYAANTDIADEQYTFEIIENDTHFEDAEPHIDSRGVYLTNVITRISQVATGKVYMRADVYCIETMSSIQTILYLQKLVNGTWTTVGSKTVSTNNAITMAKTVSVTGLSTGGTYRTKSVTKVTSTTGISETATGYSGAIILS